MEYQMSPDYPEEQWSFTRDSVGEDFFNKKIFRIERSNRTREMREDILVKEGVMCLNKLPIRPETQDAKCCPFILKAHKNPNITRY
ncbi:hypothetical protein PGT21_013311 [Puccinia graminis f. sp. tritici]|uniref:Uncharacterized protein n=1 Tax=Puccinia graminis f. sp. tritici TaxID=56615 RepID=A0A5B0LZ32_PUCGR|nr:hypothetical protein PGT21_013311 [Puccinia graminis f. sp. tritici]